MIPVHIRRPELGETPLSPEEQLIAVRDGWQPAAVATFDARTGVAQLHLVLARNIDPDADAPARATLTFPYARAA